MPHRLDNKVAIITGGTSGIGKATVELFAKEGARVVFMARGAEETGRGLPGGRAVEAAIRAEGGEVTFIACDIGNANMVEAAVAEAAKTYGPINILFNNAGGGGGGSFPDSTDEEWTRVIDPDLTGMFYVSRAVWPHIVAAGGGAVVNMSSLAAQQFFTPRRHKELGAASLSYYAAKSGIDGLTRYMAGVGGAHNIRVNGVRPGLMNRDRQAGEGGRVRDDQIIPGPGYGEDVAYLVLFLACDESRFITAQTINVDGGVSGFI